MKLWIIGGFLGAGKTSLMSALALHFRQLVSRLVILENEAGQASLDDAYLADYGVDVHSILGGCACCDLRSRFLEKLDQLAFQNTHELVFFEPSGVASLQDLVHVVKLYGPTGIRVYTTLIIDASRLPTMMKALPKLLESQLDVAEAVVMSKGDLVDPVSLESRKEWVVQKIPCIPFVSGNLVGQEADQVAEYLAGVLEGSKERSQALPGVDAQGSAHQFWSYEMRFPDDGMESDQVRLALQKLISDTLGRGEGTLGHIKFLGSTMHEGSILISGTSVQDISLRGDQGNLFGNGWLSIIIQDGQADNIEQKLHSIVRKHLPGVEITQMSAA